ncbi:MAG: F0F1 ATP synthase subunit A [Dehalococcoidia bacterium]|nr:F0F1 ATP synthase subunit A [Dehalococcoidia bacterium]
MKKISGIAVVLILIIVAGYQVRSPRPEVIVPAEVIAHPFGFPLSNTFVTSWITIAVLLVLFYRATGFTGSRMKLVPSGVQNFMEAAVAGLFDFVVGIAGEQNGRKFFPLVATIFLFIITNAWLGLLPGFGTIGPVITAGHGAHRNFQEINLGGMKLALIIPGAAQPEEKAEGAGSDAAHGAGAPEGVLTGELVPLFRPANTDLNTTLGLALIAMAFVQTWGVQANGFFSYAGRFVRVGGLLKGNIGAGALDLYVGLLETIGEVAKVISFTFRLFGNMFAGEVLLLFIAWLVPFVGVLPFLGLELFVGFVQALVFAGLTLVFSSMAVTSHGDEHSEHAESH